MDQSYKTGVYQNINNLLNKYNLSRNFENSMKNKIKSPADTYYNKTLF